MVSPTFRHIYLVLFFFLGLSALFQIISPSAWGICSVFCSQPPKFPGPFLFLGAFRLISNLFPQRLGDLLLFLLAAPKISLSFFISWGFPLYLRSFPPTPGGFAPSFARGPQKNKKKEPSHNDGSFPLLNPQSQCFVHDLILPVSSHYSQDSHMHMQKSCQTDARNHVQ